MTANKESTDDVLMYSVRDTNARTDTPRTHQVRDGDGWRDVTFKDGNDKVPLPLEFASQFLGIDGFEVYDDTGRKVVEKKTVTNPLQPDTPMLLPANQTIAKYEELTSGALRARLVNLGYTVPGNAKKDALISKLMSLDSDGEDVDDTGEAFDAEDLLEEDEDD